jgi:transposase
MAGLTADDRRLMERLRIRAVKRVIAGEHVDDVARAMGVDRSNVYKWLKKYDEGGLDGLRAKKAAGPSPKLDHTQVAQLRALIVECDPRQLQFEFALWTRDLVAGLIERRFGVVLSLSATGRLLRAMGLSPQRPLWRAYQANPTAVERWKTEEFPRIRAEADKAGALVFFADEAAVRSDYHGGTTWGEVGHPPVVATTGARHRVNMISAVSPQHKLHFRLVDGIVDADAFIAYCQALIDDYNGRPIYLIVDGHPSHRAKKTRQWVADQQGRLKLFFLPAYSPQLNPDEWVWKNVKHDRIGRAGITSAEDLRRKAMAALERIARTPSLIKGFFGDPDLRYITC